MRNANRSAHLDEATLVASGTYQVNSDCTATVIIQPGPAQTVEDRLVIVDSGPTILSASMQPAGSMITATQKKIDVD